MPARISGKVRRKGVTMKRRRHGQRRVFANLRRCPQAAERPAPARGRRMLVAMFAAATLAVCAAARQARAQTAAPATVASPAVAPAGAAIQSLAAAGTLPELHWPDFSDYRSAVAEFYSTGGWAPAWTTDGAPTVAALGMIDLFRQARLKGLNPDDYDSRLWSARLARLRSEGLHAAPADIARFDIAMTVCAMRYLSDLHLGRVNPNHVKFFLDAGSKKLDLAQTLRAEFIGAADPAAIVTQVEPPYAEYQRAEVALAHYLELARDGDEPVLPSPAASVHPSGSYPALAQLAARLKLVGDLSADVSLPAGSTRYQGAIVDAVRHFQRRHGLTADGVLGKATFAALNVPLRVRIDELGYTLERYRWMPLDFPEPPIVVNIPEFILRTMRRQPAPFLEMRVVVGKAYRHQTPVFTGTMRYVIFRPWWNVPYSITRAELIPKIVRNRNYLAANNFAVFNSSGTMVSNGAVTDSILAGLRSGALNIRQKPGPKNALGLVKFMFPNSYNVYLHSTPAPELFEKSRRDFSHGCIRVQNPVGLAAWVLRGMPEWTTDRIVQTMNGDKTLQVNLPRPIPVLIIYLTAEVEPDGEVRFFDDIYGHDAELRQALAARRRLAAAPAPVSSP
jgi:murein L,D-transpeptidase YcbB/YkuD